MAAVEEKLELPNNSIKTAIDKIVKDRGYVSYELQLDAGCKAGSNFIGAVYKISISGKKANGEIGKFNMFCKTAPTFRKSSIIRDSFVRESFVYNTILPEFQRFVEKKGITEDGFEAYPECFVANDDEDEEYLLMEDIRDDGFVMNERQSVLDFDHLKLVVENLGKLHAISFAMKDQDKDTFEKLSNLPEPLWTNPLQEGLIKLFGLRIAQAKATLDESDAKCIEKMNKFEENYMDKLYYSYDFRNAEPYAIITHGDCWNNNLLFKYENNTPVQTRLVDWQMTHYSSPVLDLLYLIFGCTSKELRDDHYEDLLKIYHESLAKFLTRLGSEPEELFPYSTLQEQLKKFGKFGLLMATAVIAMVVTDEEKTRSADEVINDPNNVALNTNTESAYKKRMSDVIRDVVRLGYI